MLKSVEGTYSNGKIELSETPHGLPDDTKIIVTFLEQGDIDLRQRGISEEQAASLRQRLNDVNILRRLGITRDGSL